MKQFFILAFITLCYAHVEAQETNSDYLSLGIFNTQNAKPFGKFTGLFGEVFHPGIEAGYGRNISTQKNHEWFIQLKISYFYHRFVQHGIPLDVNFGYRYKFNEHFSAQTSLGVGYMHSIPAVSQHKLNTDGNYENGKGAGRMQASANYSIGFGYVTKPSAVKPIKFFTAWQQRVQMPFVKSYVPLLPYNSFVLGIQKPIK